MPLWSFIEAINSRPVHCSEYCITILNMAIDKNISELLSLFVSKSNDGLAIYDSQDVLIYSNDSFSEMVSGQPAKMNIGKTFSQTMKNAYDRSLGVNIETDDIEAWIEYANSRRWKKQFRSFDVDLKDGRWVLITEQIINDKYLFLNASDITHAKKLELILLKTQSKLIEQAFKDELTEIDNRRSFNERGTEEVAKSHRQHTELSLFLLDIDHFKRINDNYGHVAGDSVLKSITSLISKHKRPYDFFARIGGEEFALLLTDTSMETAKIIVERIRAAIQQEIFTYNSLSIRSTLSFGGSQLRPDDDLSSLSSRADDYLYRAKKMGRNRVETEPDNIDN